MGKAPARAPVRGTATDKAHRAMATASARRSIKTGRSTEIAPMEIARTAIAPMTAHPTAMADKVENARTITAAVMVVEAAVVTAVVMAAKVAADAISDGAAVAAGSTRKTTISRSTQTNRAKVPVNIRPANSQTANSSKAFFNSPTIATTDSFVTRFRPAGFSAMASPSHAISSAICIFAPA